MKRPICAIALAAALTSALTVTGVAPADPSGGSEAGIAKKCKKKKKKKCKKKQPVQAPVTVFAQFASGIPAAANYNAVNGQLSSAQEFCMRYRSDLQVINTATGAPVGFGRTSGETNGFTIQLIPRQPAGTPLQVVAPANNTCLEGRSNIISAPAGAT